MAEIAAKGLKNNFYRISAIKIKYKNKPSPEQGLRGLFSHHRENDIGDGSVYANASSLSFPFLETNHADLYHDLPPRDLPEFDQTTEAQIIIQAETSVIRQIAGKLHCLGGYDVSVF